jgi:regulatory protein
MPAPDLPPGDPDEVARLICLRRLEAAPRTRSELARTLAERGVPDESAQRVLDRFEEVGLVDDPLFAEMWVRSRQSGRGLSRRALRHELHRRGVDGDVVAEALEQVSDEDERAAALMLARRKAVALNGLPAQVRVRRLAGALARKGYPVGLCHEVIREVLSDQDADLGLGE